MRISRQDQDDFMVGMPMRFDRCTARRMVGAATGDSELAASVVKTGNGNRQTGTSVAQFMDVKFMAGWLSTSPDLAAAFMVWNMICLCHN